MALYCRHLTEIKTKKVTNVGRGEKYSVCGVAGRGSGEALTGGVPSQQIPLWSCVFCIK